MILIFSASPSKPSQQILRPQLHSDAPSSSSSATAVMPAVSGTASIASATPVTNSPFTPPVGVRKVLSRLKEVGGEVANLGAGAGREEVASLRDVNRRLQAMLEETLLKNIALHGDVDNLSLQVKQLTALAAASEDRREVS